MMPQPDSRILMCAAVTMNAALTCPAGAGVPLVLAPGFETNLRADDLGLVDGVPPVYAGIGFAPGDPDTLLIGSGAVTSGGEVYAIGVVRGCWDEIIGFDGTATFFAATPFIDGGLVAGPDGVVLYTTYDGNLVGQIAPGSTAADRIIDLDDLYLESSTGSITIVPEGFDGAGQVKIGIYDASSWYDAELSADGAGTFDLVNIQYRTGGIGFGLEGAAYVAGRQPAFASDHVIVNSWDGNRIDAYAIDDEGDPIPETGREVLSLPRPEGAARDPRSGNVLVSTMGNPDRIIALRTLERCSADVAPVGGDGLVGTADLIAVLSAWAIECTPANLNRINAVDFQDLLFLLNEWGPCS